MERTRIETGKWGVGEITPDYRFEHVDAEVKRKELCWDVMISMNGIPSLTQY